MAIVCRAEHQEIGEGWFHHQEAYKDSLAVSGTQDERGKEKGSSLWIWYDLP